MPSDPSHPYREPSLPSPQSEIEQLAAVGRRAHRGHRNSEAESIRKKQAQRAAEVLSPRWAVFVKPDLDSMALLVWPLLLVTASLSAVCLVVLDVLVQLVAGPLSAGTSGVLVVILTLALSAAALLFGLRHSACVRATVLQSELDWVDALPFPLLGHLPWLADTFHPWMNLAIDFRSLPEHGLVADAIHAVVTDAEVEWSDEQQVRVQLPRLDVGQVQSRPDVRAFRVLTERVLLALHRQYGIVQAQWLEPGQLPVPWLPEVNGN